MKIAIRELAVFIALLCFILTPVRGFSQEAGDATEPVQIEKSFIVDLGYSLLGLTTSNVFLSFLNRLADQPFSHTTFSSIWGNFKNPGWYWENGDRFHVNQLGHAYQGYTYFVSARANGFNFYQSMPFVPLGAIMWELVLEPEPAINDVITTSLSGIAIGEMLHRLFLEVDSYDSAGAKIGGFVVSPMDSYNKLFNRPQREVGGGNIHSLSVRTGIDKTFAFIPGYLDQNAGSWKYPSDSWKYPGGYISMQIVYGNPFVQESRKPYNHFELYAGITSNVSTFNAVIVSDAYLFSFDPIRKDRFYTSTGLSMHYDFFNATNNIADNLGFGNIQFSSNALGWTFKYMQRFSENSHLEAKMHFNAVLWGNSMYNANEPIVDDKWVPLEFTRGTYGVGENVKLALAFSHNKAGRLDFAAYGYHIFALPVTRNHSSGNVIFVYSSLNYDFPLGTRLGIGARGTFWGLFPFYNAHFAYNVNRRLVSSCLYVRFQF